MSLSTAPLSRQLSMLEYSKLLLDFSREVCPGQGVCWPQGCATWAGRGPGQGQAGKGHPFLLCPCGEGSVFQDEGGGGDGEAAAVGGLEADLIGPQGGAGEGGIVIVIFAQGVPGHGGL